MSSSDSSSGRDDFKDYVPALFARSLEEAQTFQELLGDHDIPAILADDDLDVDDDDDEQEDDENQDQPEGDMGPAISRGVTVLVPEAFLDEASEVIAQRRKDDEESVSTGERASGRRAEDPLDEAFGEDEGQDAKIEDDEEEELFGGDEDELDDDEEEDDYEVSEFADDEKDDDEDDEAQEDDEEEDEDDYEDDDALEYEELEDDDDEDEDDEARE